MNKLKPSLITKNTFLSDGTSVPHETRVYYSKIKAITWLVISIIMLATLIWLALTDKKSYLAVIIIGTVFSFLLVNCLRRLTDNNPQIILNINGIQTGKTPFYEWKDVHNEEVITKIRRGPSYFLKYDSPSGIIEFDVNLLKINYQELTTLLIIYRELYNNKTPTVGRHL